MEQLHAHEILRMMEGNSYSEEDMDVDTLIEFLKKKGKFMPVENGFTVDISKVCNH